MKRGKFVLTTLAIFPLTIIANMKTRYFSAPGNGFKVDSGTGRNGMHYKMKGVTLNILDNKISSKDTDGALTVFEQNGLTPNGGPPLHIHLYQDEYFYIIEGEYRFQVGEDIYMMNSGDTIFLPRNIPHAFVQLTDKAKVLVSYMPAGKMEDFFKTTDAWTSPPSTIEIEKVFEEHEMKIVGPALKVE